MGSEDWELLIWTRVPECYAVVSTEQLPDPHGCAFMDLTGLQISTLSSDRNARYVGYLTTLYEVQTQSV
jgi:hypothetical protein